MKIVRHDERVLELRGRDESGQRGAGGGFIWIPIILFGGVFLMVGLVLLWNDTDGFRKILSVAAFRGATFALFGMFFLVAFGSQLFKREALILDLELSRGIYKKWRFSQRSAKQKEFRFDQVDSVSFECKIEVVTDQEGHSSEYEKWISKLRLRQRTTIPLCKLGNEVKARDIAEKVCKALGVELLDKTVERGAERIAAKDLDRPLASVRRRKHAPRAISLEEVKFPDPPPETTTQLCVDKAAREIRLENCMEKMIGDAIGAVVLLFIGVGMAVTGGGFWFLVWTERADRQSVVAIPFTVIFIAGLILIVVAPLIYFSKEHLTITSTHLVRNVRLPGHRFFASIPILGKVLSHLQDQIPLSEIESVRTNSRGNPPRVDVRSDKKILRVSKGQEDAEKLKWIAAVLRSGIRAMGH
jgi:hypothetical protein